MTGDPTRTLLKRTIVLYPDRDSGDLNVWTDAHEIELLRLRLRLAILKLEVTRIRVARERRFNPDQPRDDRGRWITTGESDEATFQSAQGDRLSGYPVDLRTEEARGGHTIGLHVGKSENFLMDRVRDIQAGAEQAGDRVERIEAGSFPSLEAATRLVNSALSRNQDLVEHVANGESSFASIRADFDSVTGFEACAATERSQPFIRDTHGVQIIILRDTGSEKGFRVLTAFPVRLKD